MNCKTTSQCRKTIADPPGNEKFRVAKKINGFWVVLLGPFSELDAKRQQDLKATENKKYLILKGGELDPLWIF